MGTTPNPIQLICALNRITIENAAFLRKRAQDAVENINHKEKNGLLLAEFKDFPFNTFGIPHREKFKCQFACGGARVRARARVDL